MADIETSLKGQVSRREVLKKGVIGAAGLTVLPAVIAACSSSAATPSPTAAPTGTPAQGATPTPEATPTPAPTTPITFGSNYSDPVPKKAMQDIVDAFTAKTGIKVTVNTVDHGTFQDQITSYLGGKPDDTFTWFSGFRMRFFAAQGFAVPIDDVWATIGSNFSDAFKVGSTGDDGHQYFVPIYNYPWAVFYRKSVFADKGYTIPSTLDDFVALCKKMQADGLVPIAFGDKDGWPAMGTFDILDLRMNGYQFHVDLMAGKNKWTDPKVVAVFNQWKDLMPYHQTGAAGRIWQDAAQALLKKQAGMYLLGMFVSQQFLASSQADLDDLDFFPYPSLGTSFDAEKALDAPIDGFMVAAKSPAGQAGAEQDSAKAFMGYLGTPEAEGIYVKADPSNVAASKNADTSGYNALQKKAVELIGAAQKITQFLDRDTRPDFAGPQGMQNFLLKFISDPNQDLSKLCSQIQAFWDALPPL
jgi:multiple sugar transport system substrate-binding protein